MMMKCHMITNKDFKSLAILWASGCYWKTNVFEMLRYVFVEFRVSHLF